MAVVGKSKDRIKQGSKEFVVAYREERSVIDCLCPFQTPAIKFTYRIIFDNKSIMKLAPEFIRCKTLHNKAAPISINRS